MKERIWWPHGQKTNKTCTIIMIFFKIYLREKITVDKPIACASPKLGLHWINENGILT